MQFFQLGENDRLKARAYFHLVDATDGISPETGEAGGKAKISINGGAPTDSANSLVAVDSTNQPGTYYLELAPTELRTPGFLSIRYKSGNTAEFVNLAQVIAFDPYSRTYGDMWGGGSVDVDYKRIQRMIEAAVASIRIPEHKETDLSGVLNALSALANKKTDINIPETDLSPVMADLGAIRAAIQAIRLPEHKETDLKPVLSAIASLEAKIQTGQVDISASADEITGLLKRIREFFELDIEQVKEGVEELKQKFNKIPYVVIQDKQEKEEDADI